MKIKVSEATERQLDWLAAKCLGEVPATDIFHAGLLRWPGASCSESAPPYTTDPAVGYPILAGVLHAFDHMQSKGRVCAVIKRNDLRNGGFNFGYGPTPLITGFRCYVESELGEEVEVPDECC